MWTHLLPLALPFPLNLGSFYQLRQARCRQLQHPSPIPSRHPVADIKKEKGISNSTHRGGLWRRLSGGR